MYTRKLNFKSKQWHSVIQPYRCLIRLNQFETSLHSRTFCRRVFQEDNLSNVSLIRRVLSRPINGHTFGRLDTRWKDNGLRFYSSKGGGRNTSEDKHVVKDVTSFDKGNVKTEKVIENVKNCDAHARLGEQDQKEWLINEKLFIESKQREYLFLSRRERFKKEFLRKVVPWEKITVSWETFPYHIDELTKNLLVESATSHLKHRKVTASYGARLASSSGRILLQSIPGTELYRERLIRALARDMKVPLLVLDSSILATYSDFNDQCTSESESEDDNAESEDEDITDSEVDDENDASIEEECESSSEIKSGSEDDTVDLQASAEALKKLLPEAMDEFEKRVSGEPESTSGSAQPHTVQSQDQSARPYKKGTAY